MGQLVYGTIWNWKYNIQFDNTISISFDLNSYEISCEYFGKKSLICSEQKNEYMACSQMLIYNWSFTALHKVNVLLEVEVGDSYMDSEMQ